MTKPRLIGINHVALEVGDIEEALGFYGLFFEFSLRSKSGTMAFIDMGDQFLALSAPRSQPADDGRHFGLVVDDREGLRDLLEREGVELVSQKRLDFLDPWGNRIEIVPYEEIQFIKDDSALRLLGSVKLPKTEQAKSEMREKGLVPPQS